MYLCHNHGNVIIALILQPVFADFTNHKIDSFLLTESEITVLTCLPGRGIDFCLMVKE